MDIKIYDFKGALNDKLLMTVFYGSIAHQLYLAMSKGDKLFMGGRVYEVLHKAYMDTAHIQILVTEL